MKFEIKGISFSTREIKEIFVSLLILSFAFSLVLYRDKIFLNGFEYELSFFLNSLLVVGLAFILHEELGHKVVAQRFGYWAEYRAWKFGLFLALILGVLSRGLFIFAAPGAVMISSTNYYTGINKEKMGKIAVAGSVVNIILSVLFIFLALIFNSNLFAMAAQVNVFLALFNMLPIGMLDGLKVMRWNRRVWGGVLGISIVLLFISGTVGLATLV